MIEKFQEDFDKLWRQYQNGDKLSFVLALTLALNSKECPNILWKELVTFHGRDIFDLVNSKRTRKRGPRKKLSIILINRRRIAAVRAADIILAGFQFKLLIDEKFSLEINIDPIKHFNRFDLALELIELSFGSLVSDVNWGGKRKTEDRGYLETFYSQHADDQEYSLDIEMNSNLQDNLITAFACTLVYKNLKKVPDIQQLLD